LNLKLRATLSPLCFFLEYLFISSTATYKDGIKISLINVANKMPKPMEITIGISIRACLEVSKIIGIKPPKGVNVVRMIGLKQDKRYSVIFNAKTKITGVIIHYPLINKAVYCAEDFNIRTLEHLI
jgi:hypothetical protein